MTKLRACKECKTLMEDDFCSACREKTTLNWKGYLIIVDPENSEIAKRLEIKKKGKYALKVR